MRAVQIKHPASLDTLTLTDLPDAPAPAQGEITVRLRASSLNYHDYAVVKGMIPAPEGRIPMSDGAGEVLAVGGGVHDYKVGDAVVSTFFPEWLDGAAPASSFTRVPGDGIDGYAREQVTAPSRFSNYD